MAIMGSRIPLELETENAMAMSISFRIASNDTVINASQLSSSKARHRSILDWEVWEIHDCVEIVQAHSRL